MQIIRPSTVHAGSSYFTTGWGVRASHRSRAGLSPPANNPWNYRCRPLAPLPPGDVTGRHSTGDLCECSGSYHSACVSFSHHPELVARSYALIGTRPRTFSVSALLGAQAHQNLPVVGKTGASGDAGRN